MDGDHHVPERVTPVVLACVAVRNRPDVIECVTDDAGQREAVEPVPLAVLPAALRAGTRDVLEGMIREQREIPLVDVNLVAEPRAFQQLRLAQLLQIAAVSERPPREFEVRPIPFAADEGEKVIRGIADVVQPRPLPIHLTRNSRNRGQ
jgi:hypothetical protein